MSTPAGMVILGAGQAGLQVAESLRAEGWEGAITLIGDEIHAPYHRPPLSKGVLLRQTSPQQIEIRGPAVLERKAITLRSAVAALSVDRVNHRVSLSDGDTLTYDGLAFATGARLRPLCVPGADLTGIFGLRTLDDTLALSRAMETARKAVIIGGGFIGLECAAALNKAGLDVTVLEAAPRLLARVSPPLIADFFAALHHAHGVHVRCGAQVSAILGENGHVSAVTTADGQVHDADLVVVGIGILANDQLARACALDCDNGIVVDDCAHTHDPAIVAAGDCAIRKDSATGRVIRLESVQNAVEQGKSAAAALLGKRRPFTAPPWFWSDQYDAKLQMVGTPQGHDQVIMRGSVTDRAFSAFYFRDGVLIGADSVNSPQDHMAARKVLEKGLSPTPAQAADTAQDLTKLV